MQFPIADEQTSGQMGRGRLSAAHGWKETEHNNGMMACLHSSPSVEARFATAEIFAARFSCVVPAGIYTFPVLEGGDH